MIGFSMMPICLMENLLVNLNGLFSSELWAQFGTCLEAPRVIDVESQLWVAVISTGPSNYPLNACYKTAAGYAFQDALGSVWKKYARLFPVVLLFSSLAIS
ncbi:DNA helicase [Sarracenia purpurea var. burkii]